MSVPLCTCPNRPQCAHFIPLTPNFIPNASAPLLPAYGPQYSIPTRDQQQLQAASSYWASLMAVPLGKTASTTVIPTDLIDRVDASSLTSAQISEMMAAGKIEEMLRILSG
ncbi:hypothetical protein FRC02_007443 [Tulasnella sp. 418]|nr:hypothetical protein FRC02_007443 [Tulasnella sp. 418]